MLRTFFAKYFDWGIYSCLGLLTLWQLVNASPVPRLWADQHCYMKLGESLAGGNGYTTNGLPYTHAPPGWPALLAAVSQLLGDSEIIFVRISILLGMAGLGLAYRVLRESEGNAIAASAVLLVATSSTYFEHVTTSAGSEAPFTLFLYAAIASTLWSDRESSPWWAPGIAGILTAAAILTRTVGIVAVGALFLWTAKGKARQPWRIAVPIVAGAAAAGVWLLYASGHAGLGSESSISEFLRTGFATISLRIPENLIAQGMDLTRVGVASLGDSFFSPWWILPIVGIGAAAIAGGLLDWLAVLWIGAFLPFLTAGGRYSIPILPILYARSWHGWKNLLTGRFQRLAVVGGVALFALLYFLDDRPRPSLNLLAEWAPALALLAIVRFRAAGLLVVLVCLLGLGQQVRLAAAGPRPDPAWQAMVRMTGWMKHNIPPHDAVVVQDGLDCITARLTPNPSFYWADGLTGNEEVQVVRTYSVRYVFRIKFSDAEGDREKLLRARQADPSLLHPIYEDADFEVFAVTP